MSYFDIYLHRLPSLLRQIKKLRRQKSFEKFYAVAVGRNPGIYRHWASCRAQIEGITNAKHQKFDTHIEAMKFLEQYRNENPILEQDYNIPKNVKKMAIVYTDGNCSKNGHPDGCAGIGVYWPDNEKYNISKTFDGRQTNVRAEIKAVITAINQAREMGIDCLTINTDSHYVIQAVLQWIPRWRKNDWKVVTGREVKNKNDLMELDEAIKNFSKIIWNHVKAHSGNEGNDKADKLASLAIQAQKRRKMEEEFSINPENSASTEITLTGLSLKDEQSHVNS